MDAQEVILVENSFRKLGLTADSVAQEFYENLIERAPDVIGLFHVTKRDQFMRLTTGLSTLVHTLGNPVEMSRRASQLGSRHRKYGVRDVHYDHAKFALMEVLRHRLGRQFNSQIEAAWSNACDEIFSAMRSA
ncbi:globin domain-containing protein [Mesorhizobium sp. M0478]|uniref:globin domain-containing protein n=1 Tax=Mesorhizobium sp. M0478 TaxID=2956947 RepID=UPI00333A6E9A